MRYLATTGTLNKPIHPVSEVHEGYATGKNLHTRFENIYQDVVHDFIE
jgi:hypothetical protein